MAALCRFLALWSGSSFLCRRSGCYSVLQLPCVVGCPCCRDYNCLLQWCVRFPKTGGQTSAAEALKAVYRLASCLGQVFACTQKRLNLCCSGCPCATESMAYHSVTTFWCTPGRCVKTMKVRLKLDLKLLYKWRDTMIPRYQNLKAGNCTGTPILRRLFIRRWNWDRDMRGMMWPDAWQLVMMVFTNGSEPTHVLLVRGGLCKATFLLALLTKASWKSVVCSYQR